MTRDSDNQRNDETAADLPVAERDPIAPLVPRRTRLGVSDEDKTVADGIAAVRRAPVPARDEATRVDVGIARRVPAASRDSDTVMAPMNFWAEPETDAEPAADAPPAAPVEPARHAATVPPARHAEPARHAATVPPAQPTARQSATLPPVQAPHDSTASPDRLAPAVEPAAVSSAAPDAPEPEPASESPTPTASPTVSAKPSAPADPQPNAVTPVVEQPLGKQDALPSPGLPAPLASEPSVALDGFEVLQSRPNEPVLEQPAQGTVEIEAEQGPPPNASSPPVAPTPARNAQSRSRRKGADHTAGLPILGLRANSKSKQLTERVRSGDQHLTGLATAAGQSTEHAPPVGAGGQLRPQAGIPDTSPAVRRGRESGNRGKKTAINPRIALLGGATVALLGFVLFTTLTKSQAVPQTSQAVAAQQAKRAQPAGTTPEPTVPPVGTAARVDAPGQAAASGQVSVQPGATSPTAPAPSAAPVPVASAAAAPGEPKGKAEPAEPDQGDAKADPASGQEKKAADLLISGHFADALKAYQALAAAHPEDPAYPAFVNYLHSKAGAGSEPAPVAKPAQ